LSEKWIVGEQFQLLSGQVVTMGSDVDLDESPLKLSSGEIITEKRAEEIAREAELRCQVEERDNQLKA